MTYEEQVEAMPKVSDHDYWTKESLAVLQLIVKQPNKLTTAALMAWGAKQKPRIHGFVVRQQLAYLSFHGRIICVLDKWRIAPLPKSEPDEKGNYVSPMSGVTVTFRK